LIGAKAAQRLSMTDKPLYLHGVPNPDRLGFTTLRYSAGDEPDPKEVERAAAILGIKSHEVDSEGYECELVGASVEGGSGAIAYVRSRAKELSTHVDIEFRVHLRSSQGSDDSWSIETYNPYFGCDVRFFRWMGESAILIYCEKHDTYVCRVAAGASALFVKIKDDWIIDQGILAYWGWKATSVSRMSLPDLHRLGPMSEDEARAAALLPSKHW
jgi:hypothetical protein